MDFQFPKEFVIISLARFLVRSNRNDRKNSTVISKMLSITFIVATFSTFYAFQIRKILSHWKIFPMTETTWWNIRNYVLQMPFTHQSTLTMNTNRFRGRRWKNSFSSSKHKRGIICQAQVCSVIILFFFPSVVPFQ